MRISVPHGLSVSRAKFVILAVSAALLAGCSDNIDRFSSNYSNPSDSDPVYTASVPKYKKPILRKITQQEVASNDETIVQSPLASAPLSAPATAYDPALKYKQAYQQPKFAYNAAPAYQQPKIAAPKADEQATVDPALTFAKPKKAVASATITVGHGMTLYGIAKANHMSVQQLALANGLIMPYSVSPGQTLTIPGVTTAQLPAVEKNVAQADATPPEPVSTPPAPKYKLKSANSVTVASGDTLYSLGRKYKVSPFAIADLNGLPHAKPLSLGQTLRIPGGAEPPAQNSADVSDGSDTKVAAAQPTVKKPAPLALPQDDTAPAQVADAPPKTQATMPSDLAPGLAMRWPLKGKVISAFGAKPNGLKNEGINIAVPEGTNIQAAESGVVAYAGNELKGYGNLILIRHAGGFVTAYAHASELLVKRGDTVKRGDVIAKAGQTGAVQSPQLHFEVRKGATALDPYKFLTSSTAMN